MVVWDIQIVFLEWLVIQIVFLEWLVIQIVFLEWLVIQIVFLGRGHTNCISWSGSYKLYFLFWDIQIVFLEWLFGTYRLYFLNGCLGHTNCIS
jgi:hypothetical protein